MKISIEPQHDLKKVLKLLNPDLYRKISVSAVNKIGTQAINAGKREARKIYNIKAKVMNKSFRTTRANQYKIVHLTRIRGYRIPLKYFGAKDTKKGVSVAIIRGQRAILTHGFMWNTHVWQRRIQGGGRVARLPIDKMRGASVPQMIKTPRARKAIYRVLRHKAAQIWRNQYKFQLERHYKRVKRKAS